MQSGEIVGDNRWWPNSNYTADFAKALYLSQEAISRRVHSMRVIQNLENRSYTIQMNSIWKITKWHVKCRFNVKREPIFASKLWKMRKWMCFENCKQKNCCFHLDEVCASTPQQNRFCKRSMLFVGNTTSVKCILQFSSLATRLLQNATASN